jgi:hypothetical protein
MQSPETIDRLQDILIASMWAACPRFPLESMGALVAIDLPLFLKLVISMALLSHNAQPWWYDQKNVAARKK